MRENRMQQVERTMRNEYLDRREAVLLAQREWEATPLRARIAVIARLRQTMAVRARELAETVPTNVSGGLHRTVADTLGSEIVPLLAACRFVEREAGRILRTRKLGRRGRPLWLTGVQTEVERAALGVVLVVGAGNYPLLLAGVQTIQALTAGNAVLWKPAPGTAAAAYALRALLVESGLNPGLLTLLSPEVESVSEAIAAGVDHVVLTGSAQTGKAVMRQLAQTLTPATMELSGCDAVFVLPGAELEHMVRAIGFGLRFNGSFTCMAPRRVFLVGLSDGEAALIETRLAAAARELAPVPLPVKTEDLLRALIADARAQRAEIALDGLGNGEDSPRAGAGATLIYRATPSMRSMQADIFAPVLSMMRTANLDEAMAASAACPYALTAAIFGPHAEARKLAGRLRVGNVLINDIVVPTVDPRVAFGGRGRSGFGVTRGAEGLLAMTTPRTVQVQHGRIPFPYQATGDGHVELFAGLAITLYSKGFGNRWDGLKRLVRAAKRLK
jgi:acyl-CoA reductase-like NAD-dependent aldehyde dehydrogenase